MSKSARVLLLALALGACSKQHPSPANSGPRILRHVPADTPYVFAALQPWSREYLERTLRDYRAGYLEAMRKLHELGGGPGLQFVAAFLDELGADPTVAGYEKLGFSATPHMVFYGIGLMPALRLEVRDPAALGATFGRSMQKSGFQVPVESHRGHQLWVYRPTVEVAVAWGFDGAELVATVAPSALLPRVLEVLFGESKLAPSLAETGDLEQLAAHHGWSQQLVGWIDLRHVASALTDEKQPLARDQLMALGATLPPAACRDELLRLVSLSPRWAGGVTELTPEHAGGSLVMELDPDVAHELVALRSPVAGVGAPLDGGVFSMGVALDVGKLLGLLRRGAEAVAARPYRCEQLAWVNQGAHELKGALDAPIPAWVNQLRGFAAVLDSVDSGLGFPSVKAYGLVAASDPVQLIDLAKRTLSSLSGLNIPPDGRPVPIPGGILPLMTGHVALKGQLLGMSLGGGAEVKLARLMSTAPLPGQPLLAFAMDGEKLQKLMETLQKTVGGNAGANNFGRGLVNGTVEITERGLVWRVTQVKTGRSP